MTHFPFSEPSVEEPEVVHEAYRQARKAWAAERDAVLMLHGVGFIGVETTRYLQEAVSFAENATFDAVQLYIIAIREAHPAVRDTATTAA